MILGATPSRKRPGTDLLYQVGRASVARLHVSLSMGKNDSFKQDDIHHNVRCWMIGVRSGA